MDGSIDVYPPGVVMSPAWFEVDVVLREDAVHRTALV